MKSGQYPILFAILLLLGLAGFFAWQYQKKKERFDWNDYWSKNAYNPKSKEPYGTYIFRGLLGVYFDDIPCKDIKKKIATELPVDSSSSQKSSYVFAGEGLYLDSLDMAHLLDFVAEGNTALIASKTIPSDLMEHLYAYHCEGEDWDDYGIYGDTTEVQFRLNVPALTPVIMRYVRQNILSWYRWNHIESRFFCDTSAYRPLGYLNDSLINFAEFPYGEGRFLLHTNPITFTNYSLLRKETRPYVSGVLSHLPKGPLYWDAVNNVPEQVARRRNGGGGRLPDEHPLTYILKQPGLAWAWYLLFGLAALWLIFRSKRRQRIIPVLPKNENTSWEFISAIANLHFRQRNYRGMAREQIRLFVAWIRERYNIALMVNHDTGALRTDAETLQKLVQVSEIPEEKINAIFQQYAASVRYEPSEDMMIELHQAIENFMKKAK
jgi:hypothetical protein